MNSSKPPGPSGVLSHGRWRVVSWLSSPTATALSFAIGVVGLVWGFASFFLSKEEADLRYAQQPIHAILLRNGEVSKLSVSYDGRAVTSDICATQVAIWNAGTRAIRSDDVLRPLALTVPPNVPILETLVRQVSRDVVGFEVGASSGTAATAKFRILEPGDGAVVQLIYAGSPGISVGVSGTIVGQGEVRRAELSGPKHSDYSPESAGSRTATMVFGLFAGGLLGLTGLGSIFAGGLMARTYNTSEGSILTYGLRALFVIAMGAGLAVWGYSKVSNALRYGLGPPFDF